MLQFRIRNDLTRKGGAGKKPAALAWVAALLCSVGVNAEELNLLSIFPAADWERSTPAEAGMDEALLEQARDHALRGGGSGMIIRGGKLVYSWGNDDTLYDLKSTTKSIGVSVLGLALQDGLVQLDDAAQMHLPEVGVPPESNAESAWLDDITVRHLATHSAGFDKTGGYVDLLFEPGSTWAYSDGGANWLADLLTVRFGSDLKDVMFARVFQPLGIDDKDITWRKHSYREDIIAGITRREFGSGIHADVDAMARIGYLYLRMGSWEGQQILPREFVEQAARPDPVLDGLPVHEEDDHPDSSSHYGLLWWNNGDGRLANVPTDAFWSWGLHDSLIVVIPSLDLVASRAGNGWRSGWNSDYAVIEPFLEPIAQSVHDDDSTPDPGQKPVATISLPADGASELEGSTIHFVGSATDHEDGDLTSGLEWVSNHEGLIGMGGEFSTSTLSVGEHTITASVTDSDGLSGSAAIELSVVKSGEDQPGEEDPPPDEGSSPGEQPPADDSGGGGGAPSFICLLTLMIFRCRAQAAWRQRAPCRTTTGCCRPEP